MTFIMTTTAKNGFGKWASIVTVDNGKTLHKLTVLAMRHIECDAEPRFPEGKFQFFGISYCVNTTREKKLKYNIQVHRAVCFKWVNITVLSSFPNLVQSCTGFTLTILTVAQR